MSAPVDWGLAGAVAALAAGGEEARPSHRHLDGAVAAAAGAVRDYTALEPATDLPEAEWVSRREWAEINLANLREAADLLTGELGELVRPPGLPGPAARAVAAPVRRLAGAQAGALVGYASRHVIAQYEFGPLAPSRPPRLLFVAPNVGAAQRSLGGPPEDVLLWIALHEVTHAVHLGSVTWLREHLRELLVELIHHGRQGVDARRVLSGAGRLVTSDPRRLLSELAATDPITLLATPAAREPLQRVQATMATIEGYAEHVMDAAAPALDADVGELRAAIERRREARSPLARLLAWLFGVELKLRQYRSGKRFADAVVDAGGVAALNRAWLGPESLPDLAELEDPAVWIERVAVAGSARL